MAKRVSLKGKGADIFFGEYSANGTTEPVAGEAVGVDPTSPTTDLVAQPDPDTAMDHSMLARKQESKKASPHASKQERMLASTVTPAEGLIAPEAIAAIWPSLSEQATVTNSFRYTDEELSGLTDALYDLNKQHGVKLTKQDIARLGLNVVLWDYQLRGESSLLGEFVLRKKRERGR